MSKPVLIALDWGSTRFRGWLLDANGQALGSFDKELGILKIKDSSFSYIFEKIVKTWFKDHGRLPVIASGMIGSLQGWMEAPYVETPAGIEEFAKHLVYVPSNSNDEYENQSIAIVPGMNHWDEGVPDVMRGEETQVAGIIWKQKQSGCYVLPGTHSKWVFTKSGRVESFMTFMSGEIFSVMVEHSILGRLMEGEKRDEEAFTNGCNQALNSSHGLLSQLFSARTMGLFQQVEAKGIHSFLSGLIIGSEIKEGISRSFQNSNFSETKVKLIGEISLCALYKKAFEIAGVQAKLIKNNPVINGLFQIAKAAALIKPNG